MDRTPIVVYRCVRRCIARNCQVVLHIGCIDYRCPGRGDRALTTTGGGADGERMRGKRTTPHNRYEVYSSRNHPQTRGLLILRGIRRPEVDSEIRIGIGHLAGARPQVKGERIGKNCTRKQVQLKSYGCAPYRSRGTDHGDK